MRFGGSGFGEQGIDLREDGPGLAGDFPSRRVDLSGTVEDARMYDALAHPRSGVDTSDCCHG